MLPPNYSVVHFDLQRTAFEGKGLSKKHAKLLIERLLQLGPVVIIGQHDQKPDIAYEQFLGSKGDVFDLRKKTTIPDVFHIINGAARFVGINSAPANTAIALNVRAFIIYGSVSPETKIYRASSVGYTDKRYDCIGCYHSSVEPSYAICRRRDQACVKNIDPVDLFAQFDNFIDGKAFTPIPTESYLRRVRQTLTLMLYNPLYKTRHLDTSALSGKSLSDGVLRIIDAFEDQFRRRQRALEARIEGLSGDDACINDASIVNSVEGSQADLERLRKWQLTRFILAFRPILPRKFVMRMKRRLEKNSPFGSCN